MLDPLGRALSAAFTAHSVPLSPVLAEELPAELEADGWREP